ncbi:MAG: isoleucine--tRNA ligase [Bacteroidetes bacterium CG23_combo_of_CG06-09_8_20_14_all_32_9]|nr:MAG: isoleucine--tRNA ligase [Bacteroidetes bacterium CG23_combo_of_CG06-09_8_20_14_all_32_9]
MAKKFNEYKQFNLSQINVEILKCWHEESAFQKSISIRSGSPDFVFYEGPPSANGTPGIHHVIARTIKDIFCRYKTLKGFRVRRKAGWDTHGLPVELEVEKSLGITKENIGKTISVEDYNNACRKDVMKYTDQWEKLTKIMGFWIDMSDPYITCDNKYIETLWWLLKQLYKKGLLYKGYSIQPYSPAAGTGLSTHELNQTGCYKNVKDTSTVAQFKIIRNAESEFLFENADAELFFLAWTTTPWTLPSNTALAVRKDIQYLKVRTFNQYTFKPVTVILAKDRFSSYFNEKNAELKLAGYKDGDKNIPFKILAEYTGKQLFGIRYEQLIAWQQPADGDAFKVVTGDFVTTQDGTGIVHIAPSFGADDFRTAKQYGLGSLTLVDKQGKFIEGCGSFSGKFVKNEYDETIPAGTETVDIEIAIMLKKENKAFKIEKYEHSYPHCWRTDKPILYYPLDSWFIKTTALKNRMLELNRTINWKPQSTGTGRFAQWLENLVDWNLSRSRFWGTPLPIWVSDDKKELKCIGSLAELKAEIEKSVKANFMDINPLTDFNENDFSKENYSKFDIHRPYVDRIILVSDTGKPMHREPDLIDVWFDSGSMPYAQMHYPFEHANDFTEYYPSDFVAEGVDQTRGWFFTLHAVAVMLFDSVAFKNIISNGLVLDKKGNKMSKRLGNVVDPFETIEKYGADPVRWYMITNTQPWDNLKFDTDSIDEVRRKFFGTLYNTYSFFALYANIDQFTGIEPEIEINMRPEIDRWIISLLNSLIKEVDEDYGNYEPTKAGRAIQEFVSENLSNWYVRLSRKRFWGSEKNTDKLSAYQTLYTCLETISKLASPIAPFYSDKIFRDLNQISEKDKSSSVHLSKFPTCCEELIDKSLEEKMNIAQKVTSMVLALRRKVNIKVRQPLGKIMLPVLNEDFAEKLLAVKDLILAEVNVKEMELLHNTTDMLVKKIKPNFKILGPKFQKSMKIVSKAISALTQADIQQFETTGTFIINSEGQSFEISLSDVEILSKDIPGWLVANEGAITIALDINITDALKSEGIARELVNRIQNIRKESGFNVTDKISINIKKQDFINQAVTSHKVYIGSQTLAVSINLLDKLEQNNIHFVEIENNVSTLLQITKVE